MNRTPLSQWLLHHCHPLWAVFHFIHANLPLTLFVIFGMAGLAQAYLAVDAGRLAIEALPPEVPLKARRRHKRVVFGFGVFLFLSAVMIAALNDKNQSDSDAKARQATSKMIEIAGEANASNGAFKDFVSHFDWSKLSQVQQKKLNNVQKQLEQTATTASSAVGIPQPSLESPKLTSQNGPLIEQQSSAYSTDVRQQLAQAARDGDDIIESLRKQDKLAQDQLNDIVGKWLKQNLLMEVPDSTPIPSTTLQSEMAKFAMREPDYDQQRLNSFLSTYRTCCLDPRGDPTYDKFATFRIGDQAYGGTVPQPTTVGALKNTKAETASAAEHLLWDMKDRIARASANGYPTRE